MLNHVWIDLAGRTELRLFGVFGPGKSGRHLIADNQFLAVLRVRAIPDLIQLIVILGMNFHMIVCSPLASCFIASGNFLLLTSGMGSKRPTSAPVSFSKALA